MNKQIMKQGLLAGIAVIVVGFVLNYIVGAIFPSLSAEYENSGVFRPWEDPLMYLYILNPIAIGLVLAWIWSKTKSLFKGAVKDKVLNFACLYWLLLTLPGMIITYGSFEVSLLMVCSWLLAGYINGLVMGLVFVKTDK